MIPRFAVIPSNGRPVLVEAVKAIAPQVDRVILVDTGAAPPLRAEDYGHNVVVVHDLNEPLNWSRWINFGLDVAASYAAGEDAWSVACINDDAIAPPGWFEAVEGAMRLHGGAAGCSVGPFTTETLVHREPGPIDLRVRMTGYAFVLRGETWLRADKAMAWWYSDDDISARARELGGVVVIPGHPVDHRHPNEQMNDRMELVEQAGRDREEFISKWGWAPF